MYFVLQKIKKEYEYLIKSNSVGEDILINYAFGDKDRRNEVFNCYYDIKTSLNILKNDR